MTMNKLLMLFIIVFVTANSVSAAEEYTAKLQYEIAQQTNGINSWYTPMQFSLNISESKTIGGRVTITYSDIGNSNTMISFSVSGGSASVINLEKLKEPTCIYGNCDTNSTGNVPLHEGSIRVRLQDIVLKSSTTVITATAGNIIDLYVQCSNGEKLYLNKGNQNNYDPTLCTTKSGWSSTTEKEIFMYLKRNYNIPFTLLIETNGGYKEEAIDTNTGKYTLQNNDKYIFNIKTRRTTIWGGEVEETGIYTLSITGMNSVSGTSAPATTTTPNQILSYTVTIGDIKEITLADGSFEGSSAFSANKIGTPEAGKTSWQLSFMESGTTTVRYTPITGTAFDIRFIVKEKTTTTTKASQPPTGNNFVGDNLLVIVAVILILIAGLYYFQKSRKPKGRITSDTEES